MISAPETSPTTALERAGRLTIRYAPKSAFQSGLQSDVGALLEARKPAARRALRVKAAMISTWFYGSYLLLVWVPLRPWQAVMASVSLGLAGAGTMMSVSHDAAHGAVSENRRINALVVLITAPFGVSRSWWCVKHNRLHHGYTQVQGVDDDLNAGRPFIRLSSDQPWHRWHRYQHVYSWALYPFMHLAMVTADLPFVFTGRIGGRRMAAPGVGRSLVLLVEKVTGLALLLTLAIVHHSVLATVGAFSIASLVAGFALASTFQLGHCLDTSSPPRLDPLTGQVEDEWAITQVKGTADVAVGNRVYTWYVGSLNHHLEHHLFPKAGHVLLKEIAPVVRSRCAAHGIVPTEFPTVWSAVCSHQRFLRHLGARPVIRAGHG